MSLRKFTPGPWVTSEETEAVISGAPVVPWVVQSASQKFAMQPHITSVGGLGQSPAEIEANARLIAAAPSMFHYLEDLAKLVAIYPKMRVPPGLESLIAKAGGES